TGMSAGAVMTIEDRLRTRNARWVAALRVLWVTVATVALIVASGAAGRADVELSLPLMGVYLVAAILLLAVALYRPRWLRWTWYAVPLLDVPMLFGIWRTAAARHPDPRSAAMLAAL